MRPRHLTTTRADGDLAVTGEEPALTARRRAVVDLPWTWLTQVHGPDVVTVTRPGEHAGAVADAAVTAVPGAALAVTTADCVPVVLLADGAVGVAHAGWKGLLAGVVGNAAEAMAALGHPPTRAVIGPCIRAARYEFGAADLDAVAARWGDAVRGTTAAGTPALDVAAGVRRALAEAGVAEVADEGSCTAADEDRFWSYRARGEAGRIATVAWLEEDGR
ncbi:MAG TPA: laccase domain-containing protein [Iamia sp.]|nr:laccase domain-containing protein [Iamia sp.]